MTSLELLIISACKAVHTHWGGEYAGIIEVRHELDAVGRKYLRMTRRLLAKGRLCPRGVSEDVLREEAERWKRGHRECATQLGEFFDLNPCVVSDVLHVYRKAIKRGRVSRFGDWILEMFKLETGVNLEEPPTNSAGVTLH